MSSQLWSIGQSKRPVVSCSNPRSDFVVGSSGGATFSKRLTTQLTTMGFRFAASSPRAPEEPLRSCALMWVMIEYMIRMFWPLGNIRWDHGSPCQQALSQWGTHVEQEARIHGKCVVACAMGYISSQRILNKTLTLYCVQLDKCSPLHCHHWRRYQAHGVCHSRPQDPPLAQTMTQAVRWHGPA